MACDGELKAFLNAGKVNFIYNDLLIL